MSGERQDPWSFAHVKRVTLPVITQPYTADTGIPVNQSSIALSGVNQGSINQWVTDLLDQSINAGRILDLT